VHLDVDASQRLQRFLLRGALEKPAPACSAARCPPRRSPPSHVAPTRPPRSRQPPRWAKAAPSS
jgi:hypothetical protein